MSKIYYPTKYRKKEDFHSLLNTLSFILFSAFLLCSSLSSCKLGKDSSVSAILLCIGYGNHAHILTSPCLLLHCIPPAHHVSPFITGKKCNLSWYYQCSNKYIYLYLTNTAWLCILWRFCAAFEFTLLQPV